MAGSMDERLERALEDGVGRTDIPERALMASIAVSLKRIADGLDRQHRERFLGAVVDGSPGLRSGGSTVEADHIAQLSKMIPHGPVESFSAIALAKLPGVRGKTAPGSAPENPPETGGPQ